MTLILVRYRQGEGVGYVHPRRPGADLVAMQAKAPALQRLHHLSTEGLSHQLVPETDPDHRRRADPVAHERLQPLYPALAVIDAGGEEPVIR